MEKEVNNFHATPPSPPPPPTTRIASSYRNATIPVSESAREQKLMAVKPLNPFEPLRSIVRDIS